MNCPLSHEYPERWVAVRLSNGLGNRLFQVATGHKIAEAWKIPQVFAMPYCLPSEHGDFDTIFKLFPDIPKIWKAEPLLAIDQVKCFEVCPFPNVSPADRVLLRGMWQAAEYVSDSFTPSWTAVLAEDSLLSRWNLSSIEQKGKTAFIHVRLGDYKILPHHQVNLLSYYVRSMDKFPSDIRFLVFSDEPEVAKTFPIFSDRCVFVDESNELHALYLMSQCKAGCITANSTFSWWGAFFGKQGSTNYRACMPAQWMVVSCESTDAIYPSWANKVPV